MSPPLRKAHEHTPQVDLRWSVQAVNITCPFPWLRPHLNHALQYACATHGATYWDWRDKPDDSFFVYVLELRGQVLYVGQTARGARARVLQHENPAPSSKVVRKFGFVQELARVNVRSRNEALGLESELRQELDASGYMVTTGRRPKPRPDYERLPHNRTVKPVEPAPPPPVQPTLPDRDEHYRTGLTFLWSRSQGTRDSAGVRITQYATVQGLLAADEWTDSDRVRAWKILRQYPRQLELCGELGGQALPAAPRVEPQMAISAKDGRIHLEGRAWHPLVQRLRRAVRDVRPETAVRISVPLDASTATMVLTALDELEDLHAGEECLAALMHVAGRPH